MKNASKNIGYEKTFSRFIGSQICDQRKLLGYKSQKALADAMQKHPGGKTLYRERICNIELGKTSPTIVELIAFSDVLHVKWEYWLIKFKAGLESLEQWQSAENDRRQ